LRLIGKHDRIRTAPHQLGRGHVCLDLQAALADSPASLSLPPAHAPAAPHAQFARTPSQWLQALRLDAWCAALRASRLCDAGPGHAPLVLQGPRLYLRRYWQHEREVRALVGARLAPEPVAPAAQIRPVLNALFAAPRPSQDTDWQKLACALALRQRFAIVTGGPGTGKTTTVVRLLALLQSMALQGGGAPLRIRLAAPTGKAAARLAESIRGALGRLPWDALPHGEALRPHVPSAATTLHRLLGSQPESRHFRHHAGNPLALDVLVVDEASMVDLEMMARLLQALPPKARLVLLGDKDQLASVEAGAVLGELCSHAQEGRYRPRHRAVAAGVRRPATAARVCDAAGTAAGPGHRHAAHEPPFRRPTAASASWPRPSTPATAAPRAGLWRAGSARPAQLPPGPAAAPCSRWWWSCAPVAGWPKRTRAVRPCALPARLHATRPARRAAPAACDAWARGRAAGAGRASSCSAPLREGPWGVTGLNATVAELLRDDGLLERHAGWYRGPPGARHAQRLRPVAHERRRRPHAGPSGARTAARRRVRWCRAWPSRPATAAARLRWVLPSRLRPWRRCSR
ncbi:MAG: AAA family ATPase, partial [Pseudorhodoferax sp.]